MERPSQARLEELKAHYAGLIAAIHQFEIEEGEPPVYFHELVPTYLKELPDLCPSPVVRLHLTAPYDSRKNASGSSEGRYLCFGLKSNPVGAMTTREHMLLAEAVEDPLLLVLLSPNGEVCTARLLGRLTNARQVEFDAELWGRDRFSRLSMAASVHSLVENSVTTFYQLTELLGEADGDEVLHRKWSIAAEMPQNASFIDPPDFLVYHSQDSMFDGEGRWELAKHAD